MTSFEIEHMTSFLTLWYSRLTQGCLKWLRLETSNDMWYNLSFIQLGVQTSVLALLWDSSTQLYIALKTSISIQA